VSKRNLEGVESAITGIDSWRQAFPNKLRLSDKDLLCQLTISSSYLLAIHRATTLENPYCPVSFLPLLHSLRFRFPQEAENP